MTTTAYRSVLAMRKLGYRSETTEHRLGRFIRKDLFGFADGIAYRAEEPVILFQAFHVKEYASHAGLAVSDAVREWLATGNRFEFHLWSFRIRKGRKFWTMERKPVKSKEPENEEGKSELLTDGKVVNAKTALHASSSESSTEDKKLVEEILDEMFKSGMTYEDNSDVVVCRAIKLSIQKARAEKDKEYMDFLGSLNSETVEGMVIAKLKELRKKFGEKK